MPEVTCTCGKRFTAARANARYCSDKCRKRTKRSGADVVEMPTPDPTPDPAGGSAGPIETSAVRELTEAQRLDTSLGWTVVALARRLDRGHMETGSAYAALSKEFEAKRAAALRGAQAATAPQQLRDELAARRARAGA